MEIEEATGGDVEVRTWSERENLVSGTRRAEHPRLELEGGDRRRARCNPP